MKMPRRSQRGWADALWPAQLRGLAVGTLPPASAKPPRADAAAGGGTPGGGPYKDTLYLPRTDFPMRASAVEREPALALRCTDSLYVAQLAQNAGPVFVLHDGPPYANGSLHIGHFLNKSLKDFVARYRLLRGDRVSFVPGWDCHGLPIELKALEGLSPTQRAALTPLSLRARARAVAESAVSGQAAAFRRWGVLADWGKPYLTMDPAYEAAQLRVLATLAGRGLLKRGLRPVHWSPSSRTALAEAELEFPAGHSSPAAWVAYPPGKITPGNIPGNIPGNLPPEFRRAAAVVWTTTPWTLPASRAVAVAAEVTYCVAVNDSVNDSGNDSGNDAASGNDASNDAATGFLVAVSRLDALSAAMGVPLSPRPSRATGAALVSAGLEFRHPLSPASGGRSVPLILAGHVTDSAGTGLVHLAPGHGHDDFAACEAAGLPFSGRWSPVDEAGAFTPDADALCGVEGGHAAPRFVGLEVFGPGTAAVVAALSDSGSLLSSGPYAHKYPYDWRTHKPVLVRSTRQWFIDLGPLESAARAAIAGVAFTPPGGRARLEAFLGSRSQWCISRQRAWGVPLPAFYRVLPGGDASSSGDDSDSTVCDAAVIRHVAALIESHPAGGDAWWETPTPLLLPPGPLRDAATRGELVRGSDTLDVWFDSGVSWAGALGSRGLPSRADLVLEGSDQHRGWFQSSLLTCVAATGGAPYAAVVTHGFVLDDAGLKMSKSAGNVLDPNAAILGSGKKGAPAGVGADALRLWAASGDYTRDVMASAAAVAASAESLRKARNCLRFALGCLSDYDPAVHHPGGAPPPLEAFLFHELAEFGGTVTAGYDAHRFAAVVAAASHLASVTLSSFYCEAVKDALYCDALGSRRRRWAQAGLWAGAFALAQSLAPIAPHVAEDFWAHATAACRAAASARPRTRPEFSAPNASDGSFFWVAWGLDSSYAPRQAVGGAVGGRWAAVRAARADVFRVLERARAAGAIGGSGGADLTLGLMWGGQGLESVNQGLESQAAAGAVSSPGALLDAVGGEEALAAVMGVATVRVTDSEADCPESGDAPPHRVWATTLPLSTLLASAGHEGAPVAQNAALRIVVRPAAGEKCARCWRHVAARSDAGGGLCVRCAGVVGR